MLSINHLKSKTHRLSKILNPLLSNSSKSFSKQVDSGLEKNREVLKNPYDGVIFKSHNDNVYEITLNKTNKYNALDLKMIREILKRVRLWVPYNIDGFSSDSNDISSAKPPKIVIFSGNGKAFCAGGDIVDLYNAKISGKNLRILKDFFRYEYLLDYSLTKIIPTQISFWNGAVMGGGVGLSINSPIRIATDSSVFAMPETKIGLFTDVGASYFLTRIMNNNIEAGVFLGLSGDKIQGKDLALSGIATHYVKEENFEKLKQILIEKIGKGEDSKDIKEISNIVSENCDFTYTKEKFSLKNNENIKKIFKPDSIENIYNRLNEVIVNDKESKAWAERVLNNINKSSPLSLIINLELLKRGLSFNSIEEAFNIEAQLVSVFMEESDFFEGVRALLIDKDNKPNWKHKSYKDINIDEEIKNYFDRNEEIDLDTKL